MTEHTIPASAEGLPNTPQTDKQSREAEARELFALLSENERKRVAALLRRMAAVIDGDGEDVQ
ncbi:hypothetical protein [Phyllobacterium leguminum]|uniref:Uncharacterized protein n=1 Tax=Phyllobacterium leguminum TaxID=314237 RepID=A0A318T3U3_9HYPH|nr:hypothetical protein [Phyllobacterium leguminum]PYE88761.1 hypothetical protein C7477_106134 [Phyllobacterium leguminum]